MKVLASVYGPVESWRVGRSLGVDLLCLDSLCSFRCIYCQLGRINQHTTTRKVYVPTARVLRDLAASGWADVDIVTLSGSGEPTLAANLGEVIEAVKHETGKPVLVLTNATLLEDARVRRDLAKADRVFCKLDAADEETFSKINRPVAGLTLARLWAGLKQFGGEYHGRLGVQLMLMPLNVEQPAAFARLLRELQPDEVQLNAPRRPVPRMWTIAARANRPAAEVDGVQLKQVSAEAAARFARVLAEHTGLKIVSAYEQQPTAT